MNANKLIFLGALLLISPMVVAQEYEQTLRNLEVVATWRYSPIVINKRCSLEDPDGTYQRDSELTAWQVANHEIIQKIDANIKSIIPPLLNGKNIYLDLVEPMQEKITYDISKHYFLDKTDDELRQFCKVYQINTPIGDIFQIETAMKALENWREANHISLR